MHILKARIWEDHVVERQGKVLKRDENLVMIGIIAININIIIYIAIPIIIVIIIMIIQLPRLHHESCIFSAFPT